MAEYAVDSAGKGSWNRRGKTWIENREDRTFPFRRLLNNREENYFVIE